MTVVAVVFGLFLVGVGLSHFVASAYYRSLVPRWVPRPERIVAVTGVIEVVLGVAVVVPATRSVGAALAAALISAYMASHVDAAVRTSRQAASWLATPLGVAARIAVNAGYIAIAVAIALSG